jgi:hypothetical protein
MWQSIGIWEHEKQIKLAFTRKIKSKLNSGSVCYNFVQTLLSPRLISKNLKTKIYKAIILPVVLYGCEKLPLTVREEQD